MNTLYSRPNTLRRTVLAHGLLLALSLSATASAFDADNALVAAARLQQSGSAEDRIHGDAVIDAASSDWRRTRRLHPSPPLPTGSLAVGNCNDHGSGSLREAIANAASGDTIDLTSMGCSEITLTTGALVVLQDVLKLQGPTDGVVIDAADQSEVIVHLGNGYLTLDHMSIMNGSKYQSAASASDARGGCIASSGVVSLAYSEVTHCVAQTMGATNVARGGAIFATEGVVVSSSLVGGAQALSVIDSAGGAISSPGAVALLNSIVTQGFAQAATGEAHGGGVDAGGLFIAQMASVLQNFAVTEDYQGSGGGVRAQGQVEIFGSSFALNASMTGGGIEMRGAGFSRSITNSTIAGNSGPGAAGILAAGSNVTIANSSIAYNTTMLPGIGSGLFAEGVDIELQSTLVAINGDPEAAIYADVVGSGTLSGANNLIHTAHITPPAGTIEQIDPLLIPIILDNAHVIMGLKPTSVAINAGNNASSLEFDQRGTGFPRQIGTATDIGSYEFDLGDLVFANAFD